MLKISKDFFSSWNEAGLLYCHWKSNEHLLPGLDGDTDLDVLLSRDDQTKGEAILHELDFLQCKSQYGSRYPNVDDWIGFDKETGKLIHLHLHYALVTGHKGMKEYELPWTERALRTRILDEEYGVYIMEPNLEMVTLYTRIGLKADFINITKCHLGKFVLSIDVQKEIDWLREKINPNVVCRLLEEYYGSNSHKMLEIMMQKSINSRNFLDIRKINEHTFRSYSRIRHFIRLRELIFFVNQKLLKVNNGQLNFRVRKKVPYNLKGISIALLGQDGAGKTTVTNCLLKWLRWKLDVRYVYMGSGDNYTSWKKELASKLPTQGLGRYLRGLMMLLALRDVARDAYKKVVKVNRLTKEGIIVIYDRFPQVNFSGINDGPKIRELLHKYFGNGRIFHLLEPIAESEESYLNKVVSFQPNMVFKLMLSPEESIRRKPNNDYETIKKKNQIIKSLVFNDSDVVSVDATMPFDEEILFIKNSIWQQIQK